METLIKVGITGQNGFMGSHLYNFLGTKLHRIKLIDFKRDYFKEKTALQKFVKSCDIIVHIAAMNRHKNKQVIYDTNINLVQSIIDACIETNATPKIIFSSSTQEERDNLYGKSKRDGKQLFGDWVKGYGGSVVSLIIPNVFGPFGKPFYNSFIATFCHQIMQNEESIILNDSVINLIYINQLSQIFYEEIIEQNEEQVQSHIVPYTYSRKVSEILNLLKEYKKQYIENGQVPKVDLNSFELDLFNTFTSFIPKDYFPRTFEKYTDSRGAFVEIIKANTAGQSSYSTTVSGITRGNHYHTRKIERFAVISGKATIKLRKIDSDEVIEYTLNGENPAYVDMPIWHTHNITNIGNTELITLFWINEPYNPKDSDTYFVEV